MNKLNISLVVQLPTHRDCFVIDDYTRYSINSLICILQIDLI